VAFAITRGAAGHSKSSGKAFKAKWVRKHTAFPSLLQSFVSCYVLWVGKPLVYAITGDLEFYYSEFSGLESPLFQLSGLESPGFLFLGSRRKE